MNASLPCTITTGPNGDPNNVVTTKKCIDGVGLTMAAITSNPQVERGYRC